MANANTTSNGRLRISKLLPSFKFPSSNLVRTNHTMREFHDVNANSKSRPKSGSAPSFARFAKGGLWEALFHLLEHLRIEIHLPAKFLIRNPHELHVTNV